MKGIIFTSLLAIALAVPMVSQAADGDVLTGDTKLACEVTLCFSSSSVQMSVSRLYNAIFQSVPKR